MKKPSILFLCRRNASCSQMAEAFAKKYAGRRFDVDSAGVSPTEVHPLACAVMAEVGLALNGHRAKHVDAVKGSPKAEMVVIVDDVEEGQIPAPWNHQNLVRWNIPDPISSVGAKGDALARFRQARDQIDWRVMSWLAEWSEA